MAPFGLIYIMNWIIFILIFVSLLRKKKMEKKTKNMKSKLKQQFIIALTLSLLFGLGWGVGFAATSSIPEVVTRTTLQVIFILLTSFQGLLIFIMHCLRSEEARKVWKNWVYVGSCKKINIAGKKSAASHSVSAGDSSTNRRKPAYNPYGTLSTSANASDTLKRAVKRDLESSVVVANEFSSIAVEEVEKRDLSLNKEEKMKYELLPHHESGETANHEGEERQLPPLSPLNLIFEEMEEEGGLDLSILSPVSDTFEVVSPKSMQLSSGEKPVQDKYDILWVNPDATPQEDPLEPSPAPATPDDVVFRPLDVGVANESAGVMMDVNRILSNSNVAEFETTTEL